MGILDDLPIPVLDGIQIKVGDKLYSLIYEWIEVTVVSEYGFKCSKDDSIISFSVYGHCAASGLTRTLYWDIPVIMPTVPKRTVEVTDWIIYFSGDNAYGKISAKTDAYIKSCIDFSYPPIYAYKVHGSDRTIQKGN